MCVCVCGGGVDLIYSFCSFDWQVHGKALSGEEVLLPRGPAQDHSTNRYFDSSDRFLLSCRLSQQRLGVLADTKTRAIHPDGTDTVRQVCYLAILHLTTLLPYYLAILLS